MSLTGQSIVAGVSAAGEGARFRAVDPSSGYELPTEFRAATLEDVERACIEAWNAFHEMRRVDSQQRAKFLDAIADEVSGLGTALTSMVGSETGLSTSRVISERERAVGVLRMFAGLVRDGSWVRACVEAGDASRRPTPKPDLRRMLRPLGPVAVFGASNFPLAYGVIGGDTASALAAGCPVVVKGHPLHPGTGELLAGAVSRAAKTTGLPAGVFSFLQAGGPRERAVGEELIVHPCIRAAGFTGSHVGGMALTRLGRDRVDPIPVFAEMGSINPVFLFKNALETRADVIAERLAQAVTNSCGQMCTCPGLLCVVRGTASDAFIKAICARFNEAETGVMLGTRLRDAFVLGIEEQLKIEGVEPIAGSVTSIGPSRSAARASGVLLRTKAEVFLREPRLREEVFGPSTVLVVCEHEEELFACAGLIAGSLTAAIFAGGLDGAMVGRAVAILEQRVGRLVFNGVPTGVEVNGAMVHGGPYPSTSAPHTTAQGVLAMERWCRPMCWQNAPESVLPIELRDENALGIDREVNGERSREAVVRGAAG